ncbi:response regulator [Paenibacillus arenilitoris]|uniref:Response regulator transcription factor n=1 Tax=Paenibacillus arenilitoris TaxID=2772299 RepID=A0A927H598_9BACL|nr:response regulator transcription factor [Paenibacillus arenilitoris]MBD2868187.1 response regulator transcription factor [Paenibacillus arenilitoris]
MTIKLLLADDHAMVRRGLQVFLSTQPDLELVGEAATGEEALRQVAALQPDVVLMDINMPGIDGIEATGRIKAAHPQVKVIILTSFSDQGRALPAIRAGARGYLLKDIEPEELARAIRKVNQGQVELHPDITGQLISSYAEPEQAEEPPGNELDELTDRERDVLRLIASGMSNRTIAEELFITEKTVKTHVSHILSKLGMSDRTQAAIYAVKRGLDR